MSNKIKPTLKHFSYGDHTVTLSTGMVARQASGAVMVDMDGTTVLVTVVGNKTSKPGQDFFPLTVDYQERTYAYGKIPGGFFRREGRPSERETLTARLIDRPCRPLFPKGFNNEVQLVVTVMSINPEVSADIPALIGASCAFTLSGLPFQGPLGAARVGYYNNTYLLNPTYTQLKESKLDLVVAGTEKAVLMVESEAAELSEDVMLGAVMYGHEQMQMLIQEISSFVEEAGQNSFEWQASEANESLNAEIKQFIEADLRAAYENKDKQVRSTAIKIAKEKVIVKFTDENSDEDDKLNIQNIVNSIEKKMVRADILSTKKRIDGRDTTTVRPIAVNVGVLPRAHGSALFTRGETQAFVVTTLGTNKDAQMVENPAEGDYRDPFMLHYNFPPYCVGETGRVGSPKRREIGHGNLARRGVKAVLPSAEEFPYVTRVVSEITESNGSSSMATVCGASLALMDAGVPLKSPVAGIAMGLIKDGEDVVVLTDILGDEDHLGDMDFKVAGTTAGVTALQMDIKIDGITESIMSQALSQAKAGRMHILDIMGTALGDARTEVSPFAPRLISFKIDSDKIRDVIGKGGSTIRALCENTGAIIEIDEDGTVTIAAKDDVSAQDAKSQVEMLIFDVEIDTIYEGEVTRIEPFGAFVSLAPNKTGLVHISQITDERVERIEDYIDFGSTVKVKVIDVDRQGRIKLSMKGLES